MKKTCLYDIEKEYDAKTAPVAGWHLAKNFPGGSSAEVKHTQENCSVFDRCHTVRYRVCGKGLFEKISGIAEFDLTVQVAEGSAFSAVFNGSMVTVIAMVEDDVLLLADNAETAEIVISRLGEVEVSDLSEQLAQLEIVGKKLNEVLADFDITEDEIPVGNAVLRRPVAEVNSIMICCHRFQVPAVTLIFTSEYAEGMWEEFVDTCFVKPAGYAAYDTLTSKNDAENPA